MDLLYMLVGGAGALLVRLGMAIHQTGMVRAKNSAGAMLRSVADIAVAALAFWAIGAAIACASGGNALGAFDSSLVFNVPQPRLAWWPWAVIGGAMVAGAVFTGAVAERSRLLPMLPAGAVLAGLVVPIAAHWAWGNAGWLKQLGFRDSAGATVFQLAGAAAGLVGAILVGPRQGKYNRDGSASAIPGHNMPLAGAGMLLTWAAWPLFMVAFIGNNTAGAALAAVNVLIAGAAGVVVSLVMCCWRWGKADLHLTFAGLIGALVAASASADQIGTRSAAIIGAVAGLVVPWVAIKMDMVWRIDDPTGAVAAHGAGAMWGALAAGVLAPGVAMVERLKLAGVQLLGAAAIAAMAGVVALLVLSLLKRLAGLRASEADEYDGLDLAQHDIGAYPDFQQNMIKSYHLREA